MEALMQLRLLAVGAVLFVSGAMTVTNAEIAASTTVQRDEGKKVLRAGNEKVLVLFTEAAGACDIAWRGKTEPGISGGGFSIEVDGKILKSEGAKTRTG